MIKIIAGKIDAGKSSKMLEIYKQNRLGDGFVCKKVYQDNKLYGYNFVRLSTNEEIPFMVEESHYQNEACYDKQFMKFRYSSQALKEVLLVIKQLTHQGIEPIYLDEIGKLELLKKGNNDALLQILKSKSDAIICVRDTLVNKVITHYRLKDYQIIGVTKHE